MKYVIAFILLLGITSSCFAQDEMVETPAAGPETVGNYLRTKGRLISESNTLKLFFIESVSSNSAWLKYVYSPSEVLKNGITHIRGLEEVDCLGKRSRTLSWIGYRKSGEAVTFGSGGEWVLTAPDTVGRTLVEAICTP
jgi:hypothetical protein